jgi:taurine dioxygenase
VTSAAPPTLDIQPLAGSVGVAVHGLDLAALDDTTFTLVRELFFEHHVLVFPAQQLEPADQVAFARRWGMVTVHPRVKPIDDHPDVIPVYDPTDPIASTWHQDQTFLVEPPSISFLVSRLLPDAGGDTMFSNQHKAFGELSPTMRSVLDGLRAVHHRVTVDPNGAPLESDRAVHPVVLNHPVTGEPALFVNRDYTAGIDGMTAPESDALLEFLYPHTVRPDFTCRHRWGLGDLVMWDNLSVLHCVVADASGDRLLHKVTVTGHNPPDHHDREKQR